MGSATETYTQVRMRLGDSVDTVWIPTKLAKLGKILKIGSENGWVVQEVFSTATREYLDEQRQFRLALAECVH